MYYGKMNRNFSQKNSFNKRVYLSNHVKSFLDFGKRNHILTLKRLRKKTVNLFILYKRNLFFIGTIDKSDKALDLGVTVISRQN